MNACKLLILSLFFASTYAFSGFSMNASSPHRVSLPNRPQGALSGSQFIQKTQCLSLAKREEAIYSEIRSGNIPDFNRKLIPITFTTKLKASNSHRQVEATIFVMPDYLSIGDDFDYIRIPVNFQTAMKLAHDLNMVLPTKKLVDLIYSHSSCVLKPSPLPPGRRMSSNQYFAQHNQLIEEQKGHHIKTGELIAGHKKDIIVTSRLLSHKDRIAIYGWHRRGGQAIQPVSTVHGARYVDYSHGLRLMSPVMLVDKQLMLVKEVLQNKFLSPLLSDEGSLAVDEILTDCMKQVKNQMAKP